MSLFVKFSIILSAFALLSDFSQAQEIGEKYEKEKKVKKERLPSNALDLVNPFLEHTKRTRYYKEFGKKTYFYEVKTIFKKERISIKFDKNGELIDIEIINKFNDLPDEIRKRIEEYLDLNFKKHHVKKIQIQYTINGKGYKDIFLIKTTDQEHAIASLQLGKEDLIIKYEIEAEVIDLNKDREFLEFLFDAEGEIEKIKTIIQRADDNILY